MLSIISHLHTSLEILGSFGQVSMAHQVLPVLELGSLLKEAFSVGSSHDIRVGVFVYHLLASGHIIPIDMELCDSRFFSQNVSSETTNVGMLWWILIHFWGVVLHVDVISYSQELLAIFVGACQQNGSDSNNIGLWKF